MAVYAYAIIGPLEKPDGNLLVEILEQNEQTPFGRFTVRDVKTGWKFETDEHHLKLRWIPKETISRLKEVEIPSSNAS